MGREARRRWSVESTGDDKGARGKADLSWCCSDREKTEGLGLVGKRVAIVLLPARALL